MLFPRSPAVRINVEGARIVEDDVTPQTGRDIQFPHHDETISHIAVDIGGSLAKVVYFKRDADSGVRLNFTRFETANLPELINFLGVLIEKRQQFRLNSPKDKKDDICIMATGGGAYKFYERIKAELGVDIHQEDEMRCLIVGLDFFINEIPGEVFTYDDDDVEAPMRLCDDQIKYPYLLVNIGSGVSMIKVSGPDSFERIGGSSLGGGTLWGLLSLLTPAKSFDEMLDHSSKGDNTKVDMLVGDIYGQGYGRIGLKATTIASTCGKVFSIQKQHEINARRNHIAHASQNGQTSATNGYHTRQGPEFTNARPDIPETNDTPKFATEDLSRSLLFAISNNIGQIALLHAQHHGIQNIYFGGSFIRGHSQTMNTLSYGFRFWSKSLSNTGKAYFLRHEGYLGAVGAFLLHQPTWASWSRRSSMEQHDSPKLNRSLSKSHQLNGFSEGLANENAIV